jgi:hypothetical protein
MASIPDYTPKNLCVGLEENSQGETVGRDPRKMTPDELNAMGHRQAPLSKIVRAKCLDCAHTEGEVRKCTAVGCALWPYRMRKNPFSTRVASEGSTASLEEYRARQRQAQ